LPENTIIINLLQQKMVSKSLNDCKIIRALGGLESLYDNEISYGNVILTAMFLADVDKANEAKINTERLKKTAQILIQKFPLLNANIWRPFDINNVNERKLGQTRYFVQRESIDFENIKLEQSDNLDYWKEAMENELATLFDLVNGPLWRLRVIKTNRADSSDQDQLAIIYTTHHALSDGRNLFSILSLYIDILTKLIEDENYVGAELPIVESTKTVDELLAEYHAKKEYSFDAIKDEYNDTLRKYSYKMADKNGESASRIKFFKIDKLVLAKLIEKMKQKAPEAKLTSVLCTIIAVCLRRLYDKYQVDDIDEVDNFQIKIATSPREKLHISNLVMGSFAIPVKCRIYVKQLNEENFWQEAERFSQEIHRKLENDEEIRKYLADIKNVSQAYNNNHNMFERTNYDILVSNRGVMIPSKSSLIRCKEHYFVGSRNCPSRIGHSVFNGITSINGTLCWSFGFNPVIVSERFHDDFIDSLEKFINHITC